MCLCVFDATHCNTLQHVATLHSTPTSDIKNVSYVCVVGVAATRCNMLQRAAISCNTLRHTNLCYHRCAKCVVPYLFVCVRCNSLPHNATHCNTLQHTTTQTFECLTSPTLKMYVRVCVCSLQHTACLCAFAATHCNTMQRSNFSFSHVLYNTQDK